MGFSHRLRLGDTLIPVSRSGGGDIGNQMKYGCREKHCGTTKTKTKKCWHSLLLQTCSDKHVSFFPYGMQKVPQSNMIPLSHTQLKTYHSLSRGRQPKDTHGFYSALCIYHISRWFAFLLKAWKARGAAKNASRISVCATWRSDKSIYSFLSPRKLYQPPSAN